MIINAVRNAGKKRKKNIRMLTGIIPIMTVNISKKKMTLPIIGVGTGKKRNTRKKQSP